MIAELLSGDPESVGPYRLLGRLGAGGMGQVYLARSPGGRLVAVKVIRPELADDEEFRARFAREVTAARNVSGMFTALVVDADIDGPEPWLATVYVPGPSLAQAVDEQGPMPVDSVRALAAGLAEGLAAIHAAGLVHRDLKPSNVLLAQDGPRVIDFGISRAVEGSKLTQTGAVMGSPGYLSPEQARGHLVGPPSDVFSLGAVLAFAASGQHAFGTGPVAALVYRVVREEPDLSGVPWEVRPLIARCLAKDPDVRPSPRELLAELGGGEFASGWLPESIAGTFGRYDPTGQVIAAETAAAASLPQSGPRLTGPGSQSPQPQPPRSAAGGRRRLAVIGAAAAAAVVAAAVATALALEGPAPRHFSASGPTQGPFGYTSAGSSAQHSRTASATAANRPAGANQPNAKPGQTPRASVSATASATPGASATPAATDTSASADPTTSQGTLTSTAPTPTPSETVTASGYTFTYSGAYYYSCSTTDFPIALGPAEPIDFINDASVAIEVGSETISPGDSYSPSDSHFGDIYTVANDSGSCLAYFGITGSAQVVVS